MKLTDLRDLLLAVTPNTFHFKAYAKPDEYIVWAEDGEADSLNADDQKEEQVLQGTIDYFTKMEYDPNFEIIQAKLNSTDLTWRLNSIQHEEETGYIHYEWIWEMV
jgi:hypothetical protein